VELEKFVHVLFEDEDTYTGELICFYVLIVVFLWFVD